jgi:asparagine synthase (glutamine-hydrolysing)
MLSGGVDSSTIATLIAQASSQPIKAFTVGFDDEFEKDEITPAREVAHRLGAEHFEVRMSLSDWLLLYGDKMSMATSLEARVPFLDLDLMRYAESIPSTLKIQRGIRKYLLKKAVQRWIPDQVIRRPKVGFETPMDAWLQSTLEGKVRELLLHPQSGCGEYFHTATIASMLEQHRARREDYSNHLLILILFEIWYQQFIAHSPV